MTLYSDKMCISQVVDTAKGLELFAAFKDAINAVWENALNYWLLPLPKNAPRHLDIWRVLPQTNCGQCGESICLAFAVALVQHTHTLMECPILQNDLDFAGHRAALEALLG